MSQFPKKWLVRAGAFALWLVAGAASSATVPQYDTDAHLGVTTCSGNTCHGIAQDSSKTNVLQNEYLTWQRQDKHAKAYSVLHTPQSERIARNLGLPNAHTADLCLDCHADNAAQGKRGAQFQVSDGVGCEGCHGGSQRWLGPHISGAVSRAQLLDQGLYPTEDPVARARLCMSCHFGNDKKFVTHQIMGAGHPRMSFELDTFTQIQPAHYVVDEDYRKRKQVASGMKVWAIGQALALEQTITLFLSRGGNGVFPELVFFDCYACHHSITDVKWARRPSTGLGPGVPRFNDSNGLMLHAVAAVVAPELAQSLQQALREFHGAMSLGRGQPRAIAPRLRDIANQLANRFAQREFGREDMRAVMGQLVRLGQSGDETDYAAAEQTTMALASITQAMFRAGHINDQQLAGMKGALDRLYDATSRGDGYRPGAFVQALGAFSQSAALQASAR